MVLRLAQGAEELPGDVEELWGSIAKLPGGTEVLTLSQGTEELWAVFFCPWRHSGL